MGIFATNSHLLGELNSWYFLGIQIIGVILVAAYAYLITTVILNILMRYTTITTTKEEQEKGLDFTFFDNKNK